MNLSQSLSMAHLNRYWQTDLHKIMWINVNNCLMMLRAFDINGD
jgi:hypothetical protein